MIVLLCSDRTPAATHGVSSSILKKSIPTMVFILTCKLSTSSIVHLSIKQTSKTNLFFLLRSRWICITVSVEGIGLIDAAVSVQPNHPIQTCVLAVAIKVRKPNLKKSVSISSDDWPVTSCTYLLL